MRAGLAMMVGTAPPAPFDPEGFGTLIGWYECDAQAFADDDPLTPWLDSSAAGNDLTQPLGGVEPVFKENIVNGLPAALFDGDNDRIRISDGAGIDLEADSTVIVVLKLNTTSGSRTVLQKGPTGASAGEYNLYFADTFDEPQLDRPFVEGGTRATNGLGTADFHVIACRVDGTDVDHFLDGAANGSDTLANGTAGTEDMVLGRREAATGFDGYIAELLIYTTPLSDPDLTTVTDYLMAKYGL